MRRKPIPTYIFYFCLLVELSCSKIIIDVPDKIKYNTYNGFKSLELTVQENDNPWKPKQIYCSRGSISWGDGPLNSQDLLSSSDGKLLFTKIPGRDLQISFSVDRRHYHIGLIIPKDTPFGTEIKKTVKLPKEPCGYSDCPVNYPEITVHWWNLKWWTNSRYK